MAQHNLAPASIVFRFTSGNVTAIGGFFFTAVIDGTPAVIDIAVETDPGPAQVSTPMPADPARTFLGFTSDTPFASLILTALPPEGFPHWPVANDLIVGVSVPEPSSGALLLSVAATLGGLERYRTRTARSPSRSRR